MQRTKGASYEREVAQQINSTLGLNALLSAPCGRCEETLKEHVPNGTGCDQFQPIVKRKIGQARDGGNDLDLGRLIVECKRYAKIGVMKWFRQAVAACSGKPGRIPCVVAREDNGESIIILRLSDYLTLHKEQLVKEIIGEDNNHRA